jgi:hypothetical protein
MAIMKAIPAMNRAPARFDANNAKNAGPDRMQFSEFSQNQ